MAGQRNLACRTVCCDPNDAGRFAGLHAAGVVGTEIPVSQAVAAEVALSFYRRFAGPENASVGEALRKTRIDLLRKGNRGKHPPMSLMLLNSSLRC
ncbi:hypothetical protein GCM10022295_93470 [Streptomyces osmaniensis]|uniref:Uncharacterized protein n=1 Tax=Streptomyces osmaniensis TaxID=593134 RepID=A0ABP6Z9X2_9ACTN